MINMKKYTKNKNTQEKIVSWEEAWANATPHEREEYIFDCCPDMEDLLGDFEEFHPDYSDVEGGI